MFKVVADVGKNRLCITIDGHLAKEAPRELAYSITQEVAKLSPGFDVINDISEAHPTDEEGLKELTRVQEFLQAQGMRRLIRVTKKLISELQMKRASKNAGYFWIVVPSMEKAEKLLDAFTMPGEAEGFQTRDYARKYRRLSVGPEHTVRFTLGTQQLSKVRITNLSAEGCFALIPAEYGDLVRRGTILNSFQFEHEDFPSMPFTAKVMRIVQGLSETSDCDTGLGIQFLSTSEPFTEWVNTYVIAHCGLES